MTIPPPAGKTPFDKEDVCSGNTFLQGGEDYYGTVSLEKVDQYLKNLAKAGLAKLK